MAEELPERSLLAATADESAKRKPWAKWYFSDWRADPKLRMCSLAARGLWADLLGYCHEADPYGFLLIEGVPPTLEEIASLVGRPLREVREALQELEKRGVFSRDELGRIYSRRMLRDKAKADKAHKDGKKGGNPRLVADDNPHANGHHKQGVNPPLKAQRPEARGQISTPRSEKRESRARRAPHSLKVPLPAGFTISDRVRDWAADKGYDRLAQRFEHFVGKARAKGYTYADWDEAFMAAIRDDWAGLKKLNGSHGNDKQARRDNTLRGLTGGLAAERSERIIDQDD